MLLITLDGVHITLLTKSPDPPSIPPSSTEDHSRLGFRAHKWKMDPRGSRNLTQTLKNLPCRGIK